MKLVTDSTKQFSRASLVVGLALFLVLLAAAGLALAQSPGDSSADEAAGADLAPFWLILDPADPVEAVLPPLLTILAELRAGGQVIAYDLTPQRSAPDAVPGLRVVALPESHSLLESLPGVLAATEALPPSPAGGLALQATTSITGRITRSDVPTQPISFATVRAYDGVSFILLNGPGGTLADAAGLYTTTVNAAFNNVKLRFTALGFAEEWYDDKASFGTADSITATGTVTNRNAQLERIGTLTGTVFFTPGGTPAAGVQVNIFKPSDSFATSFAGTAADGTFGVGLAAGTYKVQFSGAAAPEFYQDKASLAAANLVTVTTGATTTISANVARTAVITGKVSDAITSAPIVGGGVILLDTAGNFVSSAATGSGGLYIINGIKGGSYKVLFAASGYDRELYDNVPTDFSFPPQMGFSQATAVVATTGQTRTNINAALSPNTASAQIRGQVTAFDGSVISDATATPGEQGVRVDLHQSNLATGQFSFRDVTFANPTTGMYTFTNLENGSYRIQAGLLDEKIIPHAVQWYSKANVINSATPIIIANSQSVTGINIQLELGGCLAGKTVDANGVPRSNQFFQVLQVENGNQPIAVFAANGSASPIWTMLPASDLAGQGEFRACGLPSGQFIVTCDVQGAGGQTISGTVTAGQVTDVGTCTVGIARRYVPIVRKP